MQPSFVAACHKLKAPEAAAKAAPESDEDEEVLGGGGYTTQPREFSPIAVCHGVSGNPSLTASCNQTCVVRQGTPRHIVCGRVANHD